MIRRPPRSTLFPTRRSSDLATMNGRRKYVVSTTLEKPLEWSNSTLIKGNEFAEEIGNLKEQEGEDIVISGSGTRSEEHTSELQSRQYLVCRLLLEKKNTTAV